MSRIYPECLDSDPSDRSIAAEVSLRHEAEEEEDEEEEEDDGKEEDHEDEEDDEGYTLPKHEDVFNLANTESQGDRKRLNLSRTQ